ncbi:TetR/AcrR family transcriptional regulator [Priestia koreensis]|uniref:HTH tetR-type domain-containing protein n=1 Tax=Priestia koreensis TaxID=284581 RepID=A0A0M0L5M5_9BACI|nr:TetR family transcriptional regulator [Priestia koreensis]KOO46172.1 hypothetical protein AMD01_09915 [Priestia koreensis]
MSRKIQILEEAMKLFAEKGYHAASMQEIAERSGIAKASIYNYFKSKEEMAISIFRYHYEVLFKKISEIGEDEDLTPRERFIRQLTVQLQEFNRHKHFVRMRMGEQALRVNEELSKVVANIRSETMKWYCSQLLEIYGESHKQYVLDCATMLNGMMKEYLFYIFMDDKKLSLERIPSFMLDRLDSVMHGFKEEDEPLLSFELMKSFFEEEQKPPTPFHQMLQIVADFEQFLVNQPDYSEGIERVYVSLRALREELQKKEPKKVIIEALVSLLSSYDVKGIQTYIQLLHKQISTL